MGKGYLKRSILFLTNNKNALPMYEWLLQKGQTVHLSSDEITIRQIEFMRPEIIISYNYSYIIKQDIISFMNGRIINLHISYLPWNKGSNPSFWSFMDETPKGVTIHRVDTGLDTGDILCQKLIEFDEEKETFRTSYKILHNEITSLFKENWNSIKNNTIQGKKQENKGTYHTLLDYKKFTSIYPLNWDENIAESKRKIKGYNDDWN